jgi:hypothetical protein
MAITTVMALDPLAVSRSTFTGFAGLVTSVSAAAQGGFPRYRYVVDRGNK